MTIKTHKVYIVARNGFYIKPRDLHITKVKILKYVKEHPMTEDPAYGLDDLIKDLAYAGFYDNYILPINIKEETVKYIETLINKLMTK